MAVRRRRPLVPLPHPRRNLYGPVVGAKSAYSVSACGGNCICSLASPLSFRKRSAGFRNELDVSYAFEAKSAYSVSACGENCVCSLASPLSFRKRSAGFRNELDVDYGFGKLDFATWNCNTFQPRNVLQFHDSFKFWSA